jgi:hypothetical protein
MPVGRDDLRLEQPSRLWRGRVDTTGRTNWGQGHTVVTILADSGTRYQSNLFNPVFLKERSLPTPPWLE